LQRERRIAAMVRSSVERDLDELATF